MRSDAEIKAKIVELLKLEGEERSEQIRGLDSLSLQALEMKPVEHHSTRGMVSALYWVLGYEFKDIVEFFIGGSVTQMNQGDTGLEEEEIFGS